MVKRKSGEQVEPEKLKVAKRLKVDNVKQTIYIGNLNDQVNPKVLKHNLYLLSTSYGDVIDIVMKPKSRKMRGQAHIIFSNVMEASVAVKRLEGFMFFDKPLKVAYSRKTSKLVRQIEQQQV